MTSVLRVAFHLLIVSLCLPFAIASSRSCQGKGDATVVFDVTDGLGTKVGGGDVKVESFLNVDTGQDFRQKFLYAKGMWSANKIQYGRYKIRVRGNDFLSIEQPIDVCNPFVDVEIPTKFSAIRIATIPNSSDTQSPKQNELVKVISFENEDGTDFSEKFKKGEAGNIPYGLYELKAIGPIGGLIWREVDVFQPEVWVMAGFTGEYGDVDFVQPNQRLHGVVKHIPESEEPLFVKLLGVRCEANLDGKVDAASGVFSMAISAGSCPYLLLTIGRSGILDAREISLPLNGEVEIDLASAHRLFKQ